MHHPEIGNPAIRTNGNFQSGGKLGGADNTGGLFPPSEKAVVNQLVIPAKFTRARPTG